MNKRYQPRPHQNQILNYSGGWMGVSAVPGSGKTYTLSLLAAQIITSGQINEDQEVLIVTLVNSAVDNFRQPNRRLCGRVWLDARYELPRSHPSRSGP